uniref:Uncharacterized protein n=1 Tax=Panagrolaimus sp. ES5 TaxID=591445 RepID=A0AC34GJI4_9BILA
MHTDGTPPTLQHATSSSQIDILNDKIVVLENINLMKDEGGPTMIEKNGKFYQIAVNFNYGTFHNGTYKG